MTVLGLYRVVPKPLRLLLTSWLPPEYRSRIALFLSHDGVGRKLRDRLAAARFAHRHAVLLAAGGRRVVKDHRVLVVATVSAAATPLEVRARNRDAVTAVLDRISVPYFMVRGGTNLRSVVGVPAKHRDDVLRELHVAWPGEGFYLRVGRRRARPTLSDSPTWLRHAEEAALLQVFRPVCDPGGTLVLGRSFCCELEFWSADPDNTGQLAAPRRNPITAHVREDTPLAAASDFVFSAMVPALESPSVPSREEFATPHIEDVAFPIDAVYTWVDGSDPEWLDRKLAALGAFGSGQELNELAANESRYVNRDELRYSLRSLHCYAPWIRHIYLVTDDQLPPWLDPNHPRLKQVSHREIFGDAGRLPTFNSHAIETRLHRIPGLAEHFLYLNDDVFFGRPLVPQNFFHGNGLSKFFLSRKQVDTGLPTADDPPVLAAGKNNRALLKQSHGRVFTQKLKHVPHPQRLSSLQELAERFPREFEATARHQFRHPGDISVPAALQHYWSYVTGRAVPGSIRYVYSDLSDPATPVRLAHLLRDRGFDTFCLNDHDSDERRLERQARMLAEFLGRYFPMRSPFELPDELSRPRSAAGATALWREWVSAR